MSYEYLAIYFPFLSNLTEYVNDHGGKIIYIEKAYGSGYEVVIEIKRCEKNDT